MPTLVYLEKSFDCATAIKGDDYIRLLDDDGCLIASFDGISDFAAFTLQNGSYTSPTPVQDCYLAVVRDDGTLAKGGHKCSDIPTTAVDVGAASAGFGYGEAIADGGVFANDAEFLAWLTPIFEAMPDKSTKQIHFILSELSVTSVRWVGTIYKNTNAYGTIFAYGYRMGNGSSVSNSPYMIARTLCDGIWKPFEWENPPLQPDTEYRTTERFLMRPVYAQIFYVGNLPNNAPLPPKENLYSCKHVVSADLYVSYGGSGNYGNVSATSNKNLISVTASTSGEIKITATGDMSAYTAYVLVKYAKED